jgi:hypothetical protein
MVKELETSHKLFHSFCLRPNIHFSAQEEGEKIILIVRSHPLTQLSWIANGVILFIVLITIDFVLYNSTTIAQFIMINFLSVIMILSYLWFNFLAYYFNVGIITDKRVIDVDFNSILYREINEAQLNKIEDVTSKSSGYIASVFDYGDIFIQTAGTIANIELIKVPKPTQAERIISDMMEKHG